MPSPKKQQSWWQTLPGMLTGLAAVITAITGLIVAFHHAPERSDLNKTDTIAKTGGESASSAILNRPTNSTTINAPKSLPIPAGMQLKLAGGTTVIDILSAELEPLNSENQALKLLVRYTNKQRYPANFWSDSYRLIVNQVPRAPTNFLDEVVSPDSAKEGKVEFKLPANTTEVDLQISSGDEKSRLHFDLTAAKR
jgi:hypothetical protein